MAIQQQNNKLSRLQAMQERMPVLNEQARQRIQSGQALQLQQQLAGAPEGRLGTRTAQAMAPQIAAQTGVQQLQLGEQQAEQQKQAAGMALDVQAQEQQQDVAKLQLGQQAELSSQQRSLSSALAQEKEAAKTILTDAEMASAKRVHSMGLEYDNELSFMSRTQREELANISLDGKQKMVDGRLQFERDELGRKFTNERQLSDFAVLTAKNEQELANKMQSLQQAAEYDLRMMDAAVKKITETLERGWMTKEQALSQEQQRVLQDMKAQAEKEMQRKKNKAGNMRAVAGGVMVVAGAAITYFSAGTGASVGVGMMSAGAAMATSSA